MTPNQMKRGVGKGNQNFEDMRLNGDFYVDKTVLIREWWQGRDIVTLITRPRRFGKTLNMSTLNCFFSNKYADRGELFEGLKVWEDPEMREQQGKLPVIFLSFVDIKATTFDDTRASVQPGERLWPVRRGDGAEGCQKAGGDPGI